MTEADLTQQDAESEADTATVTASSVARSSVLPKKLTKQQIKAKRVECLRRFLEQASGAEFPLRVASLADRCGVAAKETLRLLSGKPLKDEIVLLAKDSDAPLCLRSQTDAFLASAQVEEFLASRVSAARQAGDLPLRQPLAAFLKDARLPTAIPWRAAIPLTDQTAGVARGRAGGDPTVAKGGMGRSAQCGSVTKISKIAGLQRKSVVVEGDELNFGGQTRFLCTRQSCLGTPLRAVIDARSVA